jgi:hypothetical protein
MRFALSLLAAVGVSVCLSRQDQIAEAADDKPDAIKEAQKVCESWAEARIKVLEDRKITTRTVASDFEMIAREVAEEKVRQFVAQHKTDSFDKESEKELLIAIWVTWRLHQVKGDLKTVLGDLDKFAKVRFKSDPAEATVSVNGLPRGKTPKQLCLSREGKYELVMTKDGYEDWRKTQYSPPASGESFDEKLKRKP